MRRSLTVFSDFSSTPSTLKCWAFGCWVLSIICILNQLRSAAVADDLPALTAIKTAYDEANSLIHTLDCDYRVNAEYKERHADQITWFQVHQIRSATGQLAVNVEAGLSDNTATNRWRTVFDGKNYSHWTESTVDSSGYFPPAGNIGGSKPRILDLPFLVECFLGARIWGKVELSELFQLDGAKVTGKESVGGTDCICVDFGEHDIASGAGSTIKRRVATKAWFDPSHSYLPKRIASTVSGNPSSYRIIETEEFAKIADSLTDRSVVLPSKAWTKNPASTFHFEITRSEVNKAVSSSDLAPMFPTGTAVSDAGNGMAPKQYVIGDPKARERLIQKAKRLNPELSADGVEPSKVPISATISSPGESRAWFSIQVIAVSVAVIGISILLLRRWRRA